MTLSNCIFCKIVDGQIPSARVWENADFIAIRDIQPQARDHLLVIPRRHFECVDSEGAHVPAAGIVTAAIECARAAGIAAGGYRLVINTRANGGQTVSHLHMHLLGGEPLGGGFGR